MRAGNSPWVCTAQSPAESTTLDPTLGLRVRRAATTGQKVIAGVPVWVVSASVSGPHQVSGHAGYDIAESGFRLVRLRLRLSARSRLGDMSSTAGRVDYSRYGEPTAAHLPRSCRDFSGSAVRLTPFRVEGKAMGPTLHDNQTVWVDTGTYRVRTPRRGDIVVFRAVPAGQPDRYFIKRIIALPGEMVAVRHQAVYINGHPLREPYVREQAMYTFPARRVPPNRYFVLGDNRNNSFDSSKWPNPWLPRRDIVGKALFVR
jgi:signal peptidase I